jgi:formylglycine-generating enzyme required for sulfatase activity/GTPase SAR1 family protein
MPIPDDRKDLNPEQMPLTPDELYCNQYWKIIKNDQFVGEYLGDSLRTSSEIHTASNRRGKRLCIVGDVGVGKTFFISKIIGTLTSSEKLCVYVNTTEFLKFVSSKSREQFADLFYLYITNELIGHTSSSYANEGDHGIDSRLLVYEFRSQLDTLVSNGELWVFFDSFDQLSRGGASLLSNLNEDSLHKVNIGVGSRSEGGGLDDFDFNTWEFIRVSPFDRKQQLDFIRQVKPAVLNRFRRLPIESFSFFSNPLMLKSFVESDSFYSFRTVTDLFAHAIIRKVDEKLKSVLGAIENAQRVVGDLNKRQDIAQGSGVNPPEIDDNSRKDITRFSDVKPPEIMELFSRIAFECFSMHNHTIGEDVSMSSDIPEFSIPEMSRVFDNLISRCYGDLRRNAKAVRYVVQSLSEFWNTKRSSSGFQFERRIVWGNRQIYEFFLAYYFANFANDHESMILRNMLFLAYDTNSQQFYNFWRFLSEMPSNCRTSEVWLASISVLYMRGSISSGSFDIGGASHSEGVMRSNEMIYRSWPTLNSYTLHPLPKVKQRANEITENWLGEFQDITNGGSGVFARNIAHRLRDDFLEIPAGRVTVSENQRWQQTYFESLRRKIQSSGGGSVLDEEEIRVRIEEQRKFCIVESRTFEVSKFALRRRTVSLDEYKLYDPTFFCEYRDVEESGDLPVVQITFFDAWAFCKWLRWDGLSCRLPWEVEWEHAAKIDFDPSQEFWWDARIEDFGSLPVGIEKVNALTESSVTKSARILPPSEKRSSIGSKEKDPKGLGLMDMQGNVWEWCQDVYEKAYPDNDSELVNKWLSDSEFNADAARVIRGGTFAMKAYPFACVSYRGYSPPMLKGEMTGFRVARDDVNGDGSPETSL